MTTNGLYVFSFTLWIPVQDASEEEEAAFLALASGLETRLRSETEDFVFQAERGGESKRLHYQGFLKMGERKRADQMGRMYQDEYPGMHFSAASTAGKEALKKYCMKQETRVAGPWSHRPIEPPKKFQGWVLDKKKVYADIMNNPRPFQSELTRMVDSAPDDRTIVWVADQEGNTGKSKWARYQASMHGAEWHTYGKSNDVINVVCDRPASGCYIFNLPRARPKEAAMCDLFATLEMIKDGYLVNYKYKGAVQERPYPHVVVLANYLPTPEDFGKAGTSKNRYKFYYIRPGDFALVPTQLTESVE